MPGAAILLSGGVNDLDHIDPIRILRKFATETSQVPRNI